MAVMTTLSNDGVVETQPVPSSEKMALDLDINGTTIRDDTNLEFEISKSSVIPTVEPPSTFVPEIHRTQNNDAVAAKDRTMGDFAADAVTPVIKEVEEVASIDTTSTIKPDTTPEPSTTLGPGTSIKVATLDKSVKPTEQDSVDNFGDTIIKSNIAPTAIAPLESAQPLSQQTSEGDSSFEVPSAATTILPLVESQEPYLREFTLSVTQAEGAELPTAKQEMDLHANGELAYRLQTNASSDSPIHPTGADSYQTHNIENLQINSAEHAPEQNTRLAAPYTSENADVQMTEADNTRPDMDMDDLFGEAAPSISSGTQKVAREREEDEDVDMNAPEAKRFKIAGSSINGDADDDDAGDGHRIITDPMKKALKTAIQGVKKLKAGKNFASPVVDMWPLLRESYVAKISNPMDLTTLDRNLMAGQYQTLHEYKAAIHLIYSNCVLFNGETHDITVQAALVEKYLLDKIPPTDYVPPAKKAARGNTPSRAPSAPRRPPRPQNTPPQPKVQTAIPRRDSNVLDRPKRETHPPKPKDFYQTPAVTATKTNRKKNALELKFCEHILSEVSKPKNSAMNTFFLEPVDVVALGIPHYYNTVKKPMDLSTMRSKLVDGRYGSAKDFEADFRLMLANCFAFNPPENMVHQKGRDLERYFNKEWEGKQRWMAANGGAPPRISGAESGDEDEDRSDEEEDDDAGVPIMVERNTLSNRVVEEQDKLIKMTTVNRGTAEEIALQTSIVDICKKSLKSMDEKIAAGNKNRKKAKVPAKVAKKPTAPAPKKPKKAAKARHVTHAEKEIISQGIAQLDDKSMQTVISWIRADVEGLAEVDDNELELDIDAVSNGCLLRLFELVTTKVPGIADHLDQPEPVYHTAPVVKPKKKNKPMGKSEQERKIAQLQQVLGSAPTAPAAQRYGDSGPGKIMPSIEHEQEEESSGDEDSESEED